MLKRSSSLAGLLLAAWLLFPHPELFTAAAQDAASPLPVQGQFRDAAIDPARGQIFLAVYDRDAIWSIDPATGNIAARVTAGRGPAALASDGQTLAVANRLGKSVTIIQLAGLSVLSEIDLSAAPGAIIALGGGRYLTANTFADSLTVIDTRGAISASDVPRAPAVPHALAATESFAAAAGRIAPSIQLYDRQTLVHLDAIPIPEPAAHLAALPGDQLVAAGESTLYLVDLKSARVAAARSISATALAASGDRIYAASGNRIEILDNSLNPLDTRALGLRASRLVSGASLLIALDPAGQRAHVDGLASLKPAAPETAPEPLDLPGGVDVVEARPVAFEVEDIPDPADTPPANEDNAARGAIPEAGEAEAPGEEEVRIARAPRPEVDAPAPEAESQADPADEPRPERPAGSREPVEPTSPATETISRDAASIRRFPIQTSGVRAPSPDRPSASPLQQLSRRTITDALTQPTEFGSTEGGFQAPDLTRNLENITFDTASKAADSDATVFSKFRAELGDLTLTTDKFTHRRTPVEVHAEGNVLITQQSSSITADDIQFQLDESGEKSPPRILAGEDGADSALDKGRLTLNNAHISEPTRELEAEYLEYDFKSGQGELRNARGQAGIYYFAADRLHLHGPQSLSGEDVWVTTCDHVHPHYKIRLSELELVDGQPVAGSNARLQLGRADTPFFLPRWQRGGVGGSPWNIDFDSGRQADIGYFVNVGQSYELSPDVALGPRLFVTEKEGVGLGGDIAYNFMENPASRFYRTRGDGHFLYTTEDRGYVHLYHRYEYSDDLIARVQVEHWGDEDFYQDFYYDAFRNRELPRSFANVTYRQPAYFATATVRPQTHGWFSQTEQVPDLTFHLLERPLAERLYVTFDTANGYYNREPRGVDGARSASTARISYAWNPHPAVAVTPFWEIDANFYTRDRRDSGSTGTFANTWGVTAQTRFHRTFAGRWGFSAFKHVVVPSITYSYRHDTSVDPLNIPQYDPIDSIFGRSRIESKLANIVYGRDAESGEVWQVGRVTLYQGNDFWNERRATEDYEIEVDVRPRPWWGFQVAGERQVTSDEDASLNRYSFARNLPRAYNAVNRLLDRDIRSDFSGSFGDYNRILSQLYYDGAQRGESLSGRVGFAYTETNSEVFNREVLYGLGYRISDKWGIGFEHIYNLEGDDLRSQTYELRRSLHCWETAIRFRDRESGFDINFEFNIKAFPGSRIKL
ncbi:MAG: hypothetical protein KF886_09440 [Candidatus Hydrogenedentes bacterium]|nr:hypothetical protein [Candidatus Hydrogenedentota bacterium]